MLRKVIVVALALVAAVSSGCKAWEKQRFSEWMVQRTQYFEVYAPAERVDEVDKMVPFFDWVYEYNQEMTGKAVKTPIKLYFHSEGNAFQKGSLTGKTSYSEYTTRLAHFNQQGYILSTVVHEVNHIFVKTAWNSVPRWFAEGAAEYWRDKKFGFSRNLIRMGKIPESSRTWKGIGAQYDQDMSGEQYAQVGTVFMFLAERYGDEFIPKWIRLSASLRNYEKAFLQLTGEKVKDVEPQWADWVNNHPGAARIYFWGDARYQGIFMDLSPELSRNRRLPVILEVREGRGDTEPFYVQRGEDGSTRFVITGKDPQEVISNFLRMDLRAAVIDELGEEANGRL